jgi:hypothetical protein
MTASEYRLHEMSLAARVAVSLCLGGDLLILGMSLGDKYLRDALLENRNWIRDIYWVTNSNAYRTWARTVDVTVVQASHTEMWSTLASTIIAKDAERVLEKRLDSFKQRLRPAVESVQRGQREYPGIFEEEARRRLPWVRGYPKGAAELAGRFEDLGYHVPDWLSENVSC